MKNVFTYGSLMFAPVWQNIVAGRYEHGAAVLPHYLRKQVKKVKYPAIVAQPQASVTGIIYFNVNSADIHRLDDFEGKIYQRDKVLVEINGRGIAAEAYVLRRQFRHLLSRFDWCPEAFAQRDIKHFLKRMVGIYR